MNNQRMGSWDETARELLADATMPIPPALPRLYRDAVLEARGQKDCDACLGSTVDLEDYQSISPCPACDGVGITNKDGTIMQHNPHHPPYAHGSARNGNRLSYEVEQELFMLTMELRRFCNAKGYDYELHKRDFTQRASDDNPQGLASTWQHLTDDEGRKFAEMVRGFMAE